MMKILKCSHCGNVAVMMVDAGVPLQCCGEKMEIMQAGVTDAAKEKHVPSVSVNGNVLQVQVGEVEHPMTAEHLIQWILLEQNNRVKYVHLLPGEKPVAEFCVESGPYAVYELCNLHGLWKTEGVV